MKHLVSLVVALVGTGPESLTRQSSTIRKTRGGVLEATLEQYGAHVTAADGAAAALAEIERRTPDVLLSEIGMPREDGYDLIRRLRNRPAGNGGKMPAIAVTAYASIADRDAALGAGYLAHIAKRFEAVVHLIASLGRSAHSRS